MVYFIFVFSFSASSLESYEIKYKFSGTQNYQAFWSLNLPVKRLNFLQHMNKKYLKVTVSKRFLCVLVQFIGRWLWQFSLYNFQSFNLAVAVFALLLIEIQLMQLISDLATKSFLKVSILRLYAGENPVLLCHLTL